VPKCLTPSALHSALGVERWPFHVGDLRRTDVAGARGVGMASVRLSAAYDDAAALPEADHVAGSHAELRRLFDLA
jgi:FMN phosphatase YigB (HAD superfamily)